MIWSIRLSWVLGCPRTTEFRLLRIYGNYKLFIHSHFSKLRKTLLKAEYDILSSALLQDRYAKIPLIEPPCLHMGLMRQKQSTTVNFIETFWLILFYTNMLEYQTYSFMKFLIEELKSFIGSVVVCCHKGNNEKASTGIILLTFFPQFHGAIFI